MSLARVEPDYQKFNVGSPPRGLSRLRCYDPRAYVLKTIVLPEVTAFPARVWRRWRLVEYATGVFAGKVLVGSNRDANCDLIEEVRSLGREDVASRLVVLDTIDLDDDPDDVRLSRHALSSLMEFLRDSEVTDPSLTSVHGEIWAQWETPGVRTYVLFKANGNVDYGQTRESDGEQGVRGDDIPPPAALTALWPSLNEEG